MIDYPDGVELLITHLKGTVEVQTERRTGAALPFLTLNRIGGGEDGLTDHGVYSLQLYTSTYSGGKSLGKQIHRKIRELSSQFAWTTPVTTSEGKFYVDRIKTVEMFHEIDPSKGQMDTETSVPKSVYRFVATYQVDLRLTSIT